jgi:hypothetical protein
MEERPLANNLDISIFDIFLKDRIKQDNILVRHCPTGAMLADFLTKPLQGNLFRKFRSALLGYQHMSALNNFSTCASSSEERVELYEKNEDEVSTDFGPEFGRNSDTHVERNTSGKENFMISKESTIDPTWAMVVSKKNRQRAGMGTRAAITNTNTCTSTVQTIF